MRTQGHQCTPPESTLSIEPTTPSRRSHTLALRTPPLVHSVHSQDVVLPIVYEWLYALLRRAVVNLIGIGTIAHLSWPLCWMVVQRDRVAITP